MWPWGHLGVAYCLLSLGADRSGRRVDAGAAVLVALGSQLPDLVDKPLAWSLAALPTGRSLGHSLLLATPVVLAVAAVLARRGRPLWGGALATGHLSHAFLDALPALWTGEVATARFLLWPVTPPIDYETPQSFAAHAAGLEVTPYQGVQVALFATAAALWVRDGRPGWAVARARVGTARSRLSDALARS